jgi:serine/threonine protein kinase
MRAQRVKSVDTDRYPAVRSLTVDGIGYRFSHQTGVGAFTRVYKASDEWGHALVVKVFTPGTPEAAWRNEAQQLRRFAGPGIVYLHRVFQHEDHTYLVLDDAGLPVSRCRHDDVAARVKTAVFIARGVLPVLARLHAAGYCHGDINPQNVLLRLDREQKLHAVSLVDFGLCRTQKQLDAGSAAMARWTPPPEYFRKQTLNGPALDIWHMGVLLLQVITGKTLDYSEADILADQPLKDAQSLQLPIGIALSAALASDPMQRPNAVGLWRAISGAIHTTSTS